MTDQEWELQELRKKVGRLLSENAKLKKEIARWEHCHRQDMEDNIRLKNQVASLTAATTLLEVPR